MRKLAVTQLLNSERLRAGQIGATHDGSLRNIFSHVESTQPQLRPTEESE
jgi:hypothetical protein